MVFSNVMTVIDDSSRHALAQRFIHALFAPVQPRDNQPRPCRPWIPC